MTIGTEIRMNKRSDLPLAQPHSTHQKRLLAEALADRHERAIFVVDFSLARILFARKPSPDPFLYRNAEWGYNLINRPRLKRRNPRNCANSTRVAGDIAKGACHDR